MNQHESQQTSVRTRHAPHLRVPGSRGTGGLIKRNGEPRVRSTRPTRNLTARMDAGRAHTARHPADAVAKTDSPSIARRLSPAEVRRRLWHMLPGFSPFLLTAVIDHDPLPFISLCMLTAFAVTLTLALLLTYHRIARVGETNHVFNAVSYPGTVLGVLWLFPGHPEFAAVVLATLAFGDGSATLIGLMLGKQPLPWNPRKTWVGTVSFIVLSAPLATLAYWWVARPSVSFGSAAIGAVCASLLAAAAESIESRVTDNLRVGVAASIGVVSAHAALLGGS